MLRDELAENLRTMVESGSGHPSGIGSLDVTDTPYTLIFPQPSGPGEGSMRDPEEMRDYLFLITSVGKDYRQAAWMSSKVQEVVVSRSYPGYTHPLVDPTGMSVMLRSLDGQGAIVPSGERLFQSEDIYRLRVTPA